MPEISDELYALLRKEFVGAEVSDSVIEALKEVYNVELAELEEARKEVHRRREMDDHLPRFNHPMTVSSLFPKGRHSPASTWIKQAYVAEAEADVSQQEYEVETALFALRRAEAAQ